MDWIAPVVTALITGGLSFLGVYFSNRKQTALINYRMDKVEGSVAALSAKVEKHNNFDRRLIVIETKLGIEPPKQKE